MILNINTDAAVVFTNKLEKLRKSALPATVFNTLNNAAFDVKMNTMPINAQESFVQRKANFFKANSKVVKASGYNISTMKSTVGFLPTSDKADFPVKELEAQENSGIIYKRKLIPLDNSRIGNSYNKNVRANARLGKVQNIIKTSEMAGKTKKERFVLAAILAGKGGYVLSTTNNIVFRIDSLPQSNRRTKKFSLKVTALYEYNKSGTIRIKKATHFMKKASIESGNKLESFFIINAKKQLNKLKLSSTSK